jgi:NodT family efflux transporter outer membrane factor (OMF) lipoprotein
MFLIKILFHRSLFFVLATVSFLSSCSVGPDYVRPTATADMPASYKEMEGWKVAQPRDGVIREAWWETYNDPQLNMLEKQVVVSNQNVAVAEAQFRQARALVQASRAGYFPTITLGASEARAKHSENLVFGKTSPSSPVSDYLLPADLTWEIDIWGRIRRTVESSRAGFEASAADLSALRLSSQAELAIDYFQMRSLDAEKQFLDKTAGYYQKSLELTTNRYASGVAARSDMLLAETQLKSTQAQAIDLGVQRAQLEHAIALLIGKPPAVFSLPVMPLVTTPPSTPAGIPSELLERRPDIAAAERRMAAANAQIGVARAAFYPTVKLSLGGGFEAANLAKWLVWPSRFWAVGPTISETIFDGGLRRAQSDQARAAYDATVASYRQTVLTGFQEVEDNLAALRILEQEAEVQDEAVKAAQQSVVIATNQYKGGIVSYLNVLVVQAAELANERTAITILGRRMAASVSLVKALGGGWNSSLLQRTVEAP